jgi:hypothetical protein
LFENHHPWQIDESWSFCLDESLSKQATFTKAAGVTHYPACVLVLDCKGCRDRAGFANFACFMVLASFACPPIASTIAAYPAENG